MAAQSFWSQGLVLVSAFAVALVAPFLFALLACLVRLPDGSGDDVYGVVQRGLSRGMRCYAYVQSGRYLLAVVGA